jgi:tetratricopeptide (TPR) repeat protein
MIVHELSEIERVADYTVDAAAAARRLDALWTRNARLAAERPPLLRRHLEFAGAYARLGAARRARELMAEHQRIMPPGAYPVVGARARALLTAAAVTAAEGKPDSALAEIRDACALLVEAFAMCQPMSLLAVAEAHDRAGRPDSAVAAYRRFAELKATRLIGPPGSLDMATPRIAPAWRRLGELLEAKGDRQGAIEAYQRFLEFWREADPELQPIVRQVRTRVDRLRRAAG